MPVGYGWESWDNGKAEFNLQHLTNFAVCSDWARRSRAARLWVKRPDSLVYTHTHTHTHTHRHTHTLALLSFPEYIRGGGRTRLCTEHMRPIFSRECFQLHKASHVVHEQGRETADIVSWLTPRALHEAHPNLPTLGNLAPVR